MPLHSVDGVGEFRLWDEGRSIAEVCTANWLRSRKFRWRERFAADGLAGRLDGYRSVEASELPRADG